jgi:TIR domain-containing protein
MRSINSSKREKKGKGFVMDEQELYLHLEEIKERLLELERRIPSSWNPVVIEPQESVFPVATPPPPPALSCSRYSIFVSYSSKDEKSLQRFLRIFTPAIDQKKLRVWSDAQLSPGAQRREEIQKELASAKIAVLLVSAHFLASDCITKHELPPLLEAAKQKGLTIFWIAVGHCLYDVTELKDYQPANNPKKPLLKMKPCRRDKVIVNICKCIMKAMEQRPHDSF